MLLSKPCQVISYLYPWVGGGNTLAHARTQMNKKTNTFWESDLYKPARHVLTKHVWFKKRNIVNGENSNDWLTMTDFLKYSNMHIRTCTYIPFPVTISLTRDCDPRSW